MFFTTGMQSSAMEDFSGLQGKSLYSGSGILWVRDYFFVSSISSFAHATAISPRPSNPLKRGNVAKPLSLKARLSAYCLHDF